MLKIAKSQKEMASNQFLAHLPEFVKESATVAHPKLYP